LAASSALSFSVSMMTSASAGSSYGSLMPVNSLMMRARAFELEPVQLGGSGCHLLTMTIEQPPRGDEGFLVF
jgi:hypothetical protein